MKKNTSIIIGISALLATAFIIAMSLYKDSVKLNDAPALAAAPDLQAKLVGDADRTLGPVAARVVLVEFLDPECESCRLMHPITKKVLAEFSGHVYFVLRYMPLHHNSGYAAAALEAAARQSKYWEALDVIFEKQPEWGSHANPRPELIMGYLKDIGLDIPRLEADMKDPLISTRIAKDKTDALALGVNGTPSFFVNGKMLMQLGEDPLREAIQEALNSSNSPTK